MRILHYSLGFPPFRTGGMTRYCMDLMQAEINQGNEVSLLWPGAYLNSGKNSKIRERKINNNIGSFELINPLPVPLLDGIVEPALFTVSKNEKVYLDFFRKENFDVLHVHSLMGLPQECIKVAKQLGIKTVFTSHDYFGICPKGSFMQGNKLCKDDHNCKDCVNCCKTGMSIKKIQMLQSTLYRKVKNSVVVKWARKQHIENFNAMYNDDTFDYNNNSVSAEAGKKYESLRNYYVELFQLFDVIHFNSRQTKDIYSKYFKVKNSEKVISISNATVRNYKKLKQIGKKIRLGYLGPVGVRKGFFILDSVLNELYQQGYQDFEFHIYNPITVEKPYLICHQPYNSSELPAVMYSMDALIVPSIWYETFGFTVLEAMSYGVPVIASDNVGARDLIEPGKNGFVYTGGKVGLSIVVKQILDNPRILSEMNKNIVQGQEIKTMEQHAKEIIDLYRG